MKVLIEPKMDGDKIGYKVYIHPESKGTRAVFYYFQFNQKDKDYVFYRAVIEYLQDGTHDEKIPKPKKHLQRLYYRETTELPKGDTAKRRDIAQNLLKKAVRDKAHEILEDVKTKYGIELTIEDMTRSAEQTPRIVPDKELADIVSSGQYQALTEEGDDDNTKDIPPSNS